MAAPSENETWLIDVGDRMIKKKATGGALGLTPPERLIYCIWVADYGMRNAGTLEAAKDLYRDYKEEAEQLSFELRLPYVHESFCLSVQALEREYFDRFERICNEIKSA